MGHLTSPVGHYNLRWLKWSGVETLVSFSSNHISHAHKSSVATAMDSRGTGHFNQCRKLCGFGTIMQISSPTLMLFGTVRDFWLVSSPSSIFSVMTTWWIATLSRFFWFPTEKSQNLLSSSISRGHKSPLGLENDWETVYMSIGLSG